MSVDKAQALLKVIEKIPMFKNLGPENARKVLMGCEFRNAGPWEVLCQHKGASNELFILLSGRLGIFSGDNVQLAAVQPVAPVGEMGLITGESRSATVNGRSSTAESWDSRIQTLSCAAANIFSISSRIRRPPPP